MKLRRALGAVAVALVALLPGALSAPARGAPGDPPPDCRYKPGQALTSEPWPQQRLNFRDAGTVTRGRSVTTGKPVTVAVIDSGFRPGSNPSLTGIDAAPVIQLAGHYSSDCVGHGTEVISIIAAQPTSSPMVGVAPDVRILPIQFTNTAMGGGSSAALAQALKIAVDAKVSVINLSTATTVRNPEPVIAQLRRAQQAGIVVVAAGGNDGTSTGGVANAKIYPAALSTEFDNIIAVAPVDEKGALTMFGSRGKFIDVAAPGAKVPVAVRVSGYAAVDGSSFAVPFVTGTVALMRAAHPDMTAAEVRNRLESTADTPPGTTPNDGYGYGVINPLLAVTSVQDDSVSVPSATHAGAIAAPGPPPQADRTLAHRALAAAFVLLGVAALTITGAATLRGNRSGDNRSGDSRSGGSRSGGDRGGRRQRA